MMRFRSIAALAGLALSLWMPPSVYADSVVTGTPDGPNTIPFATGQYTGEYQLIFSKAYFSGPVYIDQIAFASDSTPYPAPGVATYDLTAGLGTTGSDFLFPTPDFAANKRSDFTSVFSGTISSNQLDSQTFDLFITPTTPFLYDPSKGNLLFDVFVNSSTGPTNTGLSDAYTTNVTSDPFTKGVGRVFHPYSTNPNEVASDSNGLYTRLMVRAANPAVPEPAPLALLGLGVVPLGLIALRRKNAA